MTGSAELSLLDMQTLLGDKAGRALHDPNQAFADLMGAKRLPFAEWKIGGDGKASTKAFRFAKSVLANLVA